MISERTIINTLILLAGCILGPYAVITALEGNMYPLLIIVGCAFLLFFFFVVGDAMCAFPLFGACFAGKLNFLPFGLSVSDVLTFVFITYYLVAYLALRQRAFRIGPLFFFLPILVLATIILYHNHQFGLHSLGNETEGSRPALMMLVAIAAYICGVSTPTPSVKFLHYLPLLCVFLTLLGGLPYILTTYAPSLTPYVFIFSEDVNIGAYSVSVLGGREDMVREGTQAGIGGALQVFLLAYYPINTWWQPRRWFVAILSVMCLWLVLNGGFRSIVAVYSLGILAGAWCYCSWRALIFVPGIILTGYVLSVGQSNAVINLPMNVQRSLSFLPGVWDTEVQDSAGSSNAFRNAIQNVYLKEYLYKSPWLGNGFTFTQDEYEKALYMSQTAQNPLDAEYYQAKNFITTKTYHIGWISLYDAVGIVGSVAFVTLAATMLWINGLLIFGRDVDRQSPLFPLKVWIFCNCVMNLVGYFTVFGAFSITFPSLCAYGIILVHLYRLDRGYGAQKVLPKREGETSLSYLRSPESASPAPAK